ncbi:MAG TPA: glycosyltransferase, partial [Chromatiaceae bacterium]|nr:glycosyltransferase [Chromatiaceae bacterium]
MTSTEAIEKLLWWGRSDPSYSRNGVIRNVMSNLGVSVVDFKPRLSVFGHIEASFASIGDVDAIWVPCFRQRDLASASKWAKRKNIPLVFDPLISTFDKQVFERKKFLPTSPAAKKLLEWETRLFQKADVIIADTELHARYYEETLGVDPCKTQVIPVSSDENIFTFKKYSKDRSEFRILFYGNYLELHGIDVIAQAIVENKNDSIHWTLIGDGPTRKAAEEKCKGLHNIEFIDWVEYEELPKLIHDSNIVLGIFDTGNKASRVIPNKVYQALACGRSVVTLQSLAYPSELVKNPTGIYWSQAGDPSSLLDAVERAIAHGSESDSQYARAAYEKYFSNAVVNESLKKVLS